MAAVQLLGAEKILNRGGSADVVAIAKTHLNAKEAQLKEKRRLLWANKKVVFVFMFL